MHVEHIKMDHTHAHQVPLAECCGLSRHGACVTRQSGHDRSQVFHHHIQPTIRLQVLQKPRLGRAADVQGKGPAANTVLCVLTDMGQGMIPCKLKSPRVNTGSTASAGCPTSQWTGWVACQCNTDVSLHDVAASTWPLAQHTRTWPRRYSGSRMALSRSSTAMGRCMQAPSREWRKLLRNCVVAHALLPTLHTCRNALDHATACNCSCVLLRSSLGAHTHSRAHAVRNACMRACVAYHPLQLYISAICMRMLACCD
jgi:hypothetical protein